MTNTYLSGNTVRFKVEFYDFDNELIDPSVIKLIIYDNQYVKITEYTLTNLNKESVGIYFYDLIAAPVNGNKKFYYEFYGEISGKPSINRGSYLVVFAE